MTELPSDCQDKYHQPFLSWLKCLVPRVYYWLKRPKPYLRKIICFLSAIVSAIIAVPLSAYGLNEWEILPALLSIPFYLYAGWMVETQRA